MYFRLGKYILNSNYEFCYLKICANVYYVIAGGAAGATLLAWAVAIKHSVADSGVASTTKSKHLIPSAAHVVSKMDLGPRCSVLGVYAVPLNG